MSIQNNFPAINPSLLLDFANTKELDPRVTFTRASTATFYGVNGLLQSAAAGVPRFEHNPLTGESLGLLIEEQRTNLLTFSEQFDNAGWVKTNSTITANTIVAPSGELTADKFIPNNATAFTNSLLRTAAISKAASAITFTATVYAKIGEYNRILVQARDGATSVNNAVVVFSLVDGAIVSAASASGTFTAASATVAALVGNGWFRCNLTFTSSTETSLIFQVSARDSVATTGDDTSGIFLWGAQLEAGAFPTSYIKTEASQVTRSADAASMTGANFSSWYRQDEGTIYVESSKANNVGSVRAVVISDGTGSNQLRVTLSPATNIRPDWQVLNGGVVQANVLGATEILIDAAGKTACVYQANNFQQATNGSLGAADVSGNVPAVNRITFGGNEISAGNFLNGIIRKIAYYPARVTNAQLQGLTS